MLSVLTGFFLAYSDAHWGWWILFWLAFFANTIITVVAGILASQSK